MALWLNQKIIRIGQNGFQNLSWRLSAGLLEGSWGHLGPKKAPRAKKPLSDHLQTPLTPQVGSQNRQEIDEKSIQDGIKMLFDFLINFCWILQPCWLPKAFQNRSTIDKQIHCLLIDFLFISSRTDNLSVQL